jgi:hypothetical protein
MARRNQYMMELERNKTVAKWTKHHGFVIDYITEAGNKRGYHPDFLVQRMDNTVELHQMKGGQFMDSSDTIQKHDRAKTWCKQRGMKFVILTKK